VPPTPVFYPFQVSLWAPATLHHIFQCRKYKSPLVAQAAQKTYDYLKQIFQQKGGQSAKPTSEALQPSEDAPTSTHSGVADGQTRPGKPKPEPAPMTPATPINVPVTAPAVAAPEPLVPAAAPAPAPVSAVAAPEPLAPAAAPAPAPVSAVAAATPATAMPATEDTDPALILGVAATTADPALVLSVAATTAVNTDPSL